MKGRSSAANSEPRGRRFLSELLSFIIEGRGSTAPSDCTCGLAGWKWRVGERKPGKRERFLSWSEQHEMDGPREALWPCSAKHL